MVLFVVAQSEQDHVTWIEVELRARAVKFTGGLPGTEKYFENL